MATTFEIIKEEDAPKMLRGSGGGRKPIYPPLINQLVPGNVGKIISNGTVPKNVRAGLYLAATAASVKISCWIVDGIVYFKLRDKS